MSLELYKKKRSFNKTPEPEGKQKSSTGHELLFVIQKHAASHLHYDFRLELKGALKSWAVPKGPSLNPEDKRLAMLVEDHPLDYKDFEGIIPKGNYGAGEVIIWDQGTYQPAEEAITKADKEKILLKQFHAGSLRIIMHGEKIKGEYALVKSRNREENAWLLIKKTDEHASKTDITEKDKSVVSGKTLEQIAADKSSRVWKSNRWSNGQLKKVAEQKDTSEDKSVRKKRPSKKAAADSNEQLVWNILKGIGNKKKKPMPEDLKPMLATLVDEPFDNPDWIYEVKWDGYRAIAYLDNGKAELRSRNNNNFNKKFYPVHQALTEWKIKAIVDGEIVVVNEEGLSEFGALQDWSTESDGELLFYVFDILWLDGHELIDLPLTERREILAKLVPADSIVRLSETFDANGTEFFAAAEKLGLEGIVAKKADSTYIPDTRTKLWLKIKTEQRHEAVIAGYTRNEDSSKKFSALILGVYDERGKLTFIGQVGTGFTDKLQEEILQKIKLLETTTCPFPEEPVINKPTRFRRNPPKAAVTWLKPELVCEVKYQELSSDGIMRHPSFRGMRYDKKPKDVSAEIEESSAEAVKEAAIETDQQLEKDGKVKSKKSTPNSSKKTPTAEKTKSKSVRGDLLDGKEETQTRIIDGKEISFTNLSKIYWPKEKISKRDMLNYYYKVAPYMLPYMIDRPQSLNRYPDGINGESFYQKNVAGKVDEWLTTHAYENTTSEGNKTFLVCTDEASLMYIAKLGCIEMNPWHSRTSAPDNPDWCVIDLDPDTNSFEQVIEAANVVRIILEAIDVKSYIKTSGSTGMHIYIPLGGEYNYEQSKQLAELILTFAHDEIPSFTSLERSPAKRKGKIYLDFLQNRAIQTIAAPYSLRPKPGATVSAPLDWSEIKKGLDMKKFTMFTILDRIKTEGDLFKGVLGKGVNIEKVLEKITTVFG